MVEVRVEVEDPTTWPDRDGCGFPVGTAVVLLETVRYPYEDSRAVTAEVSRLLAGPLDAVIGGSPTYHRVGVDTVQLVVGSGGLADALELTRARPAVLIGTERGADSADADVDRLLSSLTARDTRQHAFRSTALAAVRPGRFVMHAFDDDTAVGVAVFGSAPFTARLARAVAGT